MSGAPSMETQPPVAGNVDPDCGCIRCLRLRRAHSVGLPVELTRMVTCQVCGNKRCPHATDHRWACTSSNEPGQAGSVYGTPPADLPDPPQVALKNVSSPANHRSSILPASKPTAGGAPATGPSVETGVNLADLKRRLDYVRDNSKLGGHALQQLDYVRSVLAYRSDPSDDPPPDFLSDGHVAWPAAEVSTWPAEKRADFNIPLFHSRH